MRLAKIVATLGPAQKSYEDIRAIIDAGVDVLRFNFSHGTHADHKRLYGWAREAANDTGRPVAVLMDLQGPKIRLGTFADGKKHYFERGQQFTITTDDVEGTVERISTTYPGLPGDVSVGDPLLVDDGRVRLRAVEVDETDILVEVEVPGYLSDHKGVNLPGVAVSVPAMTEKDIADLRFGLRMGVDWVALSFVRDAADAELIRSIMDDEGIHIPVIAKLEKPQAVEKLDEIVDAFDGLMVARGDLGVEVPLEQVPLVQKRAIAKCRREAKPVIVATQMLESMIEEPRPTRAEASDCANAVFDGADALMLSGETSVGQHWLDAVRTMARIIESSEQQGLHLVPELGSEPKTRGGAITAAAVQVAHDLDIDHMCVFTQTGDSVRRMSRLRAPRRLLAFTPDVKVRHQLALTWGVETILVNEVSHTDQMARQTDEILLGEGMADEGEYCVIVAGSPPGLPGSTNALRVHKLGDAIKGLAPAYRDDNQIFSHPEAGYGKITEPNF
ncbi:Pyruvate kinase [Brevibacterium ravenspurgense]|uniref:Pyruvate kinase n=1 Tax=Brevibacterium ravenspurgense TaxID=479117 RepID=A0A150H8E3_9MICO|nr:pyruvate kinase [Brevibacterium ravenspurgense]KXZ58118.1 Pyruvate kinase [Brevibacterium ravenspurgense]